MPKGQEMAEESDPFLNTWQVAIEGQLEVVHVNEDQDKYLKLPSTTPEQQTQFLQRIFESQQKKQEAAAESTAARINPEDLNPIIKTPGNSPTPTEQSLESIENRTKILEESLRN